MSKKIIAVAIALVCVATAFTACQKKLDMYKINGIEVPVMTDADGKALIDESNRIAVIVTDREGEIVTYENKEPQTYWATVKNSYVVDNTLYGSIYAMEGIDGWEFNTVGGLEKKRTSGKCKIQCAQIAEKDYMDKDLEEYLEMRDERNETAMTVFENEGYKVSVEKRNVELTKDKVPMVYYKEIIYNNDGSIANYSETLYFQYEGTDKYSVQYTSAEGKGLDKDFNFIDFVDNNFTLREIEEESSTETPTEAPTEAK